MTKNADRKTKNADKSTTNAESQIDGSANLRAPIRCGCLVEKARGESADKKTTNAELLTKNADCFAVCAI